jgi:hypothetical protein
MLRHEIEECKEIARLIVREEIAKAIAEHIHDTDKKVEPVVQPSKQKKNTYI